MITTNLKQLFNAPLSTKVKGFAMPKFLAYLSWNFGLILTSIGWASSASSKWTQAQIPKAIRAYHLAVVDKIQGRYFFYDPDHEKILSLRTCGAKPHETAINFDRTKVAISTPGYELAGNDGNTIEIIEVPSGASHCFKLPDTKNLHGIDFIPNSQEFLVTSEGTQAIALVSAASKQIISSWDTSPHGCHMIRYLPKIQGFIATCRDSNAAIIMSNMKQKQKRQHVIDQLPGVEAVTTDGHSIWLGLKGSHEVLKLDLKGTKSSRQTITGQPIRAVVGKIASIQKLFVISTNGVLSILDAQSLKIIEEITITEHLLATIALSPDERYAVIGDERGGFHILNTASHSLSTWPELSHFNVHSIDGLSMW